jgi:hypothetical protein
MALRWCAAGMVEAGKQFRRVNGHLHLPALRDALDRHVAAATVSATRQNEPVTVASVASAMSSSSRRGFSRDRSMITTGPPPKFNDGRDILFRRVGGWTPDNGGFEAPVAQREP